MSEQKESPPSYRLTYYVFNGRAGASRLAAAIGGISFEEKIVTWEEHRKAKAEGNRRWSGLPELTVLGADGKELATVGQSNAILRYIGKIGGLYPSNPVLAAFCDEILDSMEALNELIDPSMGEKDQTKKEEMRHALMEASKLPYWFGKFEKRLAENEARGSKNGFFVGDDISVADCKFYFGLLFLRNLDGLDVDKLMEPNKKLSAWQKSMKTNEKVKKWEAEYAELKKKNSDDKVTTFRIKGKNVYGSLS